MDFEYPGWIRPRLADGNEGWAPADLFVHPPDRSALATTPYDARELNTNPGDSLEGLPGLIGWFWAHNAAGEEGWNPVATSSIP